MLKRRGLQSTWGGGSFRKEGGDGKNDWVGGGFMSEEKCVRIYVIIRVYKKNKVDLGR